MANQRQQMLGVHGRLLPAKRQQIMDFIHAELDAGRSFPGPTAIAKHMGWNSVGSARDALFKLVSYDRVLTRRQDGSHAILGEASKGHAAATAVLPKQVEGSAISPPTKEQLMGGRARP